MTMFEYVSVLTSVIVGLGVAHLLQGVARLVQHPGRTRIYWVHLLWVLFMFFAAIFWWWFEFGLVSVETWTFRLYLFVLSYAVLLYLMCALLFPSDLKGYPGPSELTRLASNAATTRRRPHPADSSCSGLHSVRMRRRSCWLVLFVHTRS